MNKFIIGIIIFVVIFCSFHNLKAQKWDAKIDSLKQVLKTSSGIKKANTLNDLSIYTRGKSIDVSMAYADSALKVARQIDDKEEEGKALHAIGLGKYYQGNYKETLENWLKVLEIFKELNNEEKVASIWRDCGVIHKNWGNFDTAIVYYQRSLKIYERLENKDGAASNYNNIASVYWSFETEQSYEKAIEYYTKALKLYEEIEKILNVGVTLNNIGLVYGVLSELKTEDKEINELNEKSLKYYKDALKVFEEIHNERGIAQSKGYIGNMFSKLKQHEQALEYSKQSLEINRKIGNEQQFPYAYNDIGKIYFRWGKYSQALHYYNKSLEYFITENQKREILDIYKNISIVYDSINNYKDAYFYYKQYSELKDSTFTEESHKQITEMQTKYESEKKEQANKLLTKEKEQQQTIIYAFIGGLTIVIIFSVLLVFQFNATRKANIKLGEQNTEISLQRDQIMGQKQSITDSILYAKRIQRAIFPPKDFINEILPHHFILFKPRDIVSGDFYWMTHIPDMINNGKGKVVTVAADCTGHGVPGAFMSMLGISLLNEIVNQKGVHNADEILNQLRDNIIRSLHQTGKQGETKDGMDLALCIIDLDNMELRYSGAYNSLYIIRNNELLETKADRMPIGIYFRKQKPFSGHTIKIESDDCIYTFSDGFVDQFGGAKGGKFMTKKFKRLLLEIHKSPMDEQKARLDNEIKIWQGIENGQIDDILVLGVKV